MASKFFNILSDIRGQVGASASGTISVRIPTTGRIFNLKAQVARGSSLATLAQMRAAITEMRVLLGSEVIRRLSFAEYEFILNANNYTVEAGLMPLYFAEPWRALVLDEEILALEARRYETLTLEIDVTNDTTALSFNFDYEFDTRAKLGMDGKPTLGIIDYTRQIESLGAGDPIFKLDPLNGALQRIHILVPDSVTLSRVRLLDGETAIYDRYQTTTNPGLKHQLKDMGMTIPAAHALQSSLGSHTAWPLIPDNNQQLRNFLDNGASLRLQLSLSASCSVRIIRETQFAR